MSRANINKEYVAAADSSIAFESQVIELKCPLRAVNYQVCWETGVRGELIWEASIFDDPFKWETLVNCEEVTLGIPLEDDPTALSSIVSITGIWLTVGWLRFRWVPSTSIPSSGNIDVAIRIVPV